MIFLITSVLLNFFLLILQVTGRPNRYNVTSYGADPTGETDSTDAILRAISDALQGPNNGFLINGIVNLGGAQINLEGGNYLISRPLQLLAGRGNLMVCCCCLLMIFFGGNDSVFVLFLVLIFPLEFQCY